MSRIDLAHIDLNVFGPAPWVAPNLEMGLTSPSVLFAGPRGAPGLLDHLRPRLEAWLKRPVARDELMVTAGVQNGIHLSLAALGVQGGRVIIPDPDYPLASATAVDLGAEVVRVPLTWQGGIARLNQRQLDEAFLQGDVRAVLLSSPNNPTGSMYERSQFLHLLDRLEQSEGTLVVDELYGRSSYGLHLEHPASVPAHGRRVITLLGPSKVEALLGLRAGLAVAPAALIARMAERLHLLMVRPPAFAQVGLCGWMSADDNNWVGERVSAWMQLRDLALSLLTTSPDIRVEAPSAGPYAFVNASVYGPEPAAIASSAGIDVTPGDIFGDEGRGHFRLCFAQSRGALEGGIGRLMAAFGGAGGRR